MLLGDGSAAPAAVTGRGACRGPGTGSMLPPEVTTWLSVALEVRDGQQVHGAVEAMRVLQRWGRHLCSGRRRFQLAAKRVVAAARRVQRWWRAARWRRDARLEAALQLWFRQRGGLTAQERSRRFREQLDAAVAGNEPKARRMACELAREADLCIMMEALMATYRESCVAFAEKWAAYIAQASRRRGMRHAHSSMVTILHRSNTELDSASASASFSLIPPPRFHFAPSFDDLQCRYESIKASDTGRRADEYRAAIVEDVANAAEVQHGRGRPQGAQSTASRPRAAFVAFTDEMVGATAAEEDEAPAGTAAGAAHWVDRRGSTLECERAALAAAYGALPDAGPRLERVLWTNDVAVYYSRRRGRDAFLASETRRLSRRLTGVTVDGHRVASPTLHHRSSSSSRGALDGRVTSGRGNAEAAQSSRRASAAILGARPAPTSPRLHRVRAGPGLDSLATPRHRHRHRGRSGPAHHRADGDDNDGDESAAGKAVPPPAAAADLSSVGSLLHAQDGDGGGGIGGGGAAGEMAEVLVADSAPQTTSTRELVTRTELRGGLFITTTIATETITSVIRASHAIVPASQLDAGAQVKEEVKGAAPRCATAGRLDEGGERPRSCPALAAAAVVASADVTVNPPVQRHRQHHQDYFSRLARIHGRPALQDRVPAARHKGGSAAGGELASLVGRHAHSRAQKIFLRSSRAASLATPAAADSDGDRLPAARAVMHALGPSPLALALDSSTATSVSRGAPNAAEARRRPASAAARRLYGAAPSPGPSGPSPGPSGPSPGPSGPSPRIARAAAPPAAMSLAFADPLPRSAGSACGRRVRARVALQQQRQQQQQQQHSKGCVPGSRVTLELQARRRPEPLPGRRSHPSSSSPAADWRVLNPLPRTSDAPLPQTSVLDAAHTVADAVETMKFRVERY